MKKVLYLCNSFPPVGGSGIQRQFYFAKYFPASGWSPLILTVKETAARAYDETLLEDLPDACQIKRTGSLQVGRLVWLGRGLSSWAIPKKDAGPVQSYGSRGLKGFQFPIYLVKLAGVLRSWVLMPDDGLLWIPLALGPALRWIRTERPDLILGRAGPHSVNLLAWLLGRLTGLPYILDWADPWTQRPYYHMPTRLHRFINESAEAAVLKGASHVVVICEQMKRDLARKYPFIKGRVSVITNGYDSDAFSGLAEPSSSRKFTISHIGTLDTPRVESLVNLCVQVVAAELDQCVEVFLVGRVDLDLDRLKERFPFVRYVGYKPHQECLQYLVNSDVLLLCMKELTGETEGTITIPGKLFEYLAARRPILALGPQCDAMEIIRTLGAGLVASPSDSVRIIDHLTYLYDLWSRRECWGTSRSNVDQFERRSLSREMVKIMDSTVL